MGADSIEFGRGELRVVGGDYGQLVLEGTTAEARRTLDAIVAATRRGSDGVVVDSCVVEHNDQADLFESRHAGREGTPESGVADVERHRGPVERPTSAKGATASSSRKRTDEGRA
jgi:hypothetical protein